MFQMTIDCTVSLILNKQLVCGIVPLLLDCSVKMPFILQYNKPFLLLQEDISKLIRSLFCFISEDQAVTGIVKTMVSFYVQTNAVQGLNKL